MTAYHLNGTPIAQIPGVVPSSINPNATVKVKAAELIAEFPLYKRVDFIVESEDVSVSKVKFDNGTASIATSYRNTRNSNDLNGGAL